MAEVESVQRFLRQFVASAYLSESQAMGWLSATPVVDEQAKRKRLNFSANANEINVSLERDTAYRPI